MPFLPDDFSSGFKVRGVKSTVRIFPMISQNKHRKGLRQSLRKKGKKTEILLDN